jgi:tetratricopeptide (TPR) repeat protein
MKKAFLVLAFLLAPISVWATTGDEYYSAGLTLFRQGDFEKSVQYFHAALEAKPDMWEAYQYMGESFYQLGNRTEGVVAIRRSLKLHSDNPTLKKFLAGVETDSPWVPRHSLQAMLPWVSILLSLFALGWTFYSNGRRGPGSN